MLVRFNVTAIELGTWRNRILILSFIKALHITYGQLGAGVIPTS